MVKYQIKQIVAILKLQKRKWDFSFLNKFLWMFLSALQKHFCMLTGVVPMFNHDNDNTYNRDAAS